MDEVAYHSPGFGFCTIVPPYKPVDATHDVAAGQVIWRKAFALDANEGIVGKRVPRGPLCRCSLHGQGLPGLLTFHPKDLHTDTAAPETSFAHAVSHSCMLPSEQCSGSRNLRTV